MEGNPNVRPTPQLVLGIFVIILGILFTLDNLNFLVASHFLRFWPLLLIALGLAKFFDSAGAGGRLAGLLLMGLGSLLLLNNLNVFRFHFWSLWPLLLVFVGGSMLYRALTRDGYGHGDSDATINAFAILSGVERTFNSQDFRGGELTAVMGGCEIDLRQAAIQADQAVLNVFAMWGGIEIRIPEEWVVVVQGFPVLGGISDSTRLRSAGASYADIPRKRLLIKGLVIMGGVEIKN